METPQREALIASKLGASAYRLFTALRTHLEGVEGPTALSLVTLEGLVGDMAKSNVVKSRDKLVCLGALIRTPLQVPEPGKRPKPTSYSINHAWIAEVQP